MPKLLLLARFVNWKFAAHSINPSSLFILARGQAFFKILFLSGDRGSDLGMVTTEEILRFPQDDGLLFNHVWGKTPRDGPLKFSGFGDILTRSCVQIKRLRHMLP